MNYNQNEPDEHLKSESAHDPKMVGNNNIESDDSDEYEDEGAADWDDDYDEPDPSDEYGSSGEKYGWYNGYSDDVIDDAFEGDPEATWNVD